MKRYKNKDTVNKTYIVAHATPYGGATYLSVVMANYLCSVLGYETLYLEIDEISQLMQIVVGKSERISGCLAYGYKGVKYIVSIDAKEARKIILSNECNIVINVKEINDSNRELIGLCDRLFLIGRMNPWNKDYYMDYVSEQINKIYDVNKITFVSDARKKEKRNFESVFGLKMERTPVIEDPFKLKQSELSQIEELLL